ncbi:MAG: hypothetical protein RLZZ416_512 [Candidatus Parcubacteria bacterium]
MFQVILLVAFGAFAIAGVLIFSFAIGGGNSNAIGSIKVWGTLNQTAFSTVIRQASDQNAQLSGVSYEQRDPAAYEADLTNALASGQGPDLFLMREDYAIKDAEKVTVIPPSALTAAQFSNTFLDAARPFLTENGAIAVPMLVDPLVLYWNKDLLASAGFAEPPKYWDEFFRIAQRISVKDDAGNIKKSGVGFGEYANVDNAKDILAALILQAGGSITDEDSAGHLVSAILPRVGGTSQSTVSALRFYTEFADPSKNDYSWNRSLPRSQQAFAAGDAGLYVGYASEEAVIARSNPNLNFAAAALPQVRSASASISTAHVYALAAPKNGKHVNSAITAAFLLASSANSHALSVALGVPSARRDVVNAVANAPDSAAQGNDVLFARMAIIARSWLDPDPEKTGDLFRAMIENTTSGAMLVTEAVQRADQQMSQILGI